MRFVPKETIGGGGSPVGNTYLSTYARCPRKWFNSFFRPFEGSDGIKPKFQSEHLLKGSTFHEGIAELYLSGCRDGEDTGEWNLDQAIDLMEHEHLRRQTAYESIDKWEDDLGLVKSMLVAYYSEFGPEGPAQDYPTIKVLHDGYGVPLVERDFSVDLGYGGYIYTCRADLLISHHGYPRVMEHKTSAPGMWAQKRCNSIHHDSQFTGEFFVLRSLFPDEIIDGVMINVVIKNGRTRIAMRDNTTRTDEDLKTYRMACLDILKQIDSKVDLFNDAISKGISMEVATNIYFPDHGERTGACMEYGGCEFQRLCRNKTREEQVLRSFVPRTKAEVSESTEFGGG